MEKNKKKNIYNVVKANNWFGKKKRIENDTIKVLEENTGRKISDIPHSNIFTDTSPRVRDIKKKQ